MSQKISQLVVLLATIFMFSAHSAFAKADPTIKNKTTSSHLALIYHVEGKDIEKRFNTFVEKKIQKIGYKLTDPHKRVNDVYKKLYGSTILDILSFIPVVNDEVVKPLFNIDPRLAGFNPFNMLIYKKLDEKKYHIGHMTPTAILDILGIKDHVVREAYTRSFEALDQLLDATFGKENRGFIDYKSLPDKRMMNFELTFDRPDFLDDFIDEFQESFEEKFAENEYVIAGFHNYKEDEDDPVLGGFDAFWTYSLCHMKYSSSVFDGEGARPDGGVFAPCTMYMFIPKGSDKLIIGMPRLANVKAALEIKDQERVDFIDRLDREIPEILKQMGAVESSNTNPLAILKTVKKEKKIVPKTFSADLLKQIEISNKKLATMYVIDGSIEDKYNAFVEKSINKIGFKLTDPHKRVNDVYKKKYGNTNLDVLSFMSIANESVVKPLFNIDPRIAGFNPFNLLIYKKLDEDKTHVGHLTANAILDMLSITDQKVRDAYSQSIAQLDRLIKKELGGKEEVLEAKAFAKERMMNFAVTFEKGEDIEDVVDNFQEAFEKAFEDKKYIIAGFNNFKETDGEDTIPDYDAFWTYSLCHFKFSYTIFDGKGGHPEGGLFAPCTMFMYIKKGENKIVIGMPRLINWKMALGIDDKVRSDFIAKLDREIPEILTSKLGAVEIENSNPLLAIVPKKTIGTKIDQPEKVAKPVTVKTVKAPAVRIEKPVQQKGKSQDPIQEKVLPQNGYKIQLPKPPVPVKALHVITQGGSDIYYTPSEETNPHDHTIIFSQRRPPQEGDGVVSPAEGSKKNTLTGSAISGRVSAYLRTGFMDTKQAKANLEKAGFKVLGITPVNKKGTLTTITFTSNELLALAQKKNSGFVGVMRLLVDEINKQVSITNPLYFARAYMGDMYDAKTVQTVLKKINTAFAELKNSKDKLKFTLLPKYRFMDGMPFYKDMVEIAKAANSKVLLSKLKSKDGGKSLKFVQEIAPDVYLVGVQLGKRTSKFIKKTGINNASLLPYPILLEKGVAKIMEPKYYISVNYPMLKMSNFMKIATIPDAIRNDCEKLLK